MKWIDEKGRIGGVLNLFDLMAILAAALLIGYYGFSTPAMIPPEPTGSVPPTGGSVPPTGASVPPAPGPGAETRKAPKGSPVVIRDVQFVFRDLDPALAARIRPGNKDTTHPDTTAEILEVLGNDPQYNVVNLGTRKVLASAPEQKRMVRVRMKISGLLAGKTFYYKQQPFIRGKSYMFVTSEYTLVGEALRMDDTFITQYLPVRRRLRIWARTRFIEKTLAEMPRAGDRALPAENDSKGRFLWLEVKRVSRPQFKPGRETPKMSDIYWPMPALLKIGLNLECLCAYSDQKGFTYGDQILVAGQAFSFKTKLYHLPLRVERIEVLPLDTPPPEGS